MWALHPGRLPPLNALLHCSLEGWWSSLFACGAPCSEGVRYSGHEADVYSLKIFLT